MDASSQRAALRVVPRHDGKAIHQVTDLLAASSFGTEAAQALRRRAAALEPEVADRIDGTAPPYSVPEAVPPAERGEYAAALACHLSGVTPPQLEYWAQTGLVVPSGGTRARRSYTVHDLLLLKVVVRLLNTGVSVRNIRVALAHLRIRTTAQLQEITLFSDGASVYECTSPEEIVDLLKDGRGMFGIAVAGALQELLAVMKDEVPDFAGSE
ncbi:MerR-like DNA binding protein [Amycolatopsis sulphurea]|uniref:MerR-like DNA binding protein n=1 Tax=Amycolatopsis sulphurea TaxID=76022 RepID=A0A2A9G492_9PSEU|nr:MerR-like DNA binding protein [Amycolatopsis sulphurea]